MASLSRSQTSSSTLLLGVAVAATAAAALWTGELEILDLLHRYLYYRNPVALADHRRRRASKSTAKLLKEKNETGKNVKVQIIPTNDTESWTQTTFLSSNDVSIHGIEHNEQEVYARVSIGKSSNHFLVLLVPFCRALQAEWNKSVHTYTFCIVADVTGGHTKSTVQHVLSNNAAGLQNMTPLWLTQWARELDALSRSTKITILQALCRLHARSSGSNVVPLIVPMGMIPHLWPELTELFPHDRRVFCYTGCAEASGSDEPIITKSITTLRDSLFLTSAKQLYTALAPLSWKQAVGVEDWMAAIDTLICEQEDRIDALKRKDDSANTPPFICRIDYLRDEETAYFARRALYQYMTGDRRTDAIIPTVQLPSCASIPSPTTQLLLQRAAFCHHRILLANKTLPDTVAPVEHWGLQQAVKGGGCACCGGDDEDEENDEAKQTSTTGAKFNDFVDGKMSFAFDPTRFAA